MNSGFDSYNQRPEHFSLIDQPQLKRILGRSDSTMRRWLEEEIIPPPDLVIKGKKKYWYPKTLRKTFPGLF